MVAKKEPESHKDLVQVAARISKDKYTELKVLAAKNNMFLNDLITEGIDYILKKYSDGTKVRMKTGAVKKTKK